MIVGWLLLAIWASWLMTLQGRFAGLAEGVGQTPAWLPDAGVLLFVSLAPFLQRDDLLPAGLLIGCARVSVSIDPPAAILAAYVAIALAARGIRRLLALDGIVVRATFAGLATLGLGAWLAVSNQARGTLDVDFAQLSLFEWRLAFATAVWAGLCAPLLARLPGLTPLRKRRSWPTAVSFI